MSESQAFRILIVDDEFSLMKALCDTLHDEGMETVGFTSPKAALNAIKQERFDLLLSDLMMPEIDGIALLQNALEIDPNLVGIIMTGEGTIETAVEAMKKGALDYVLKPFKVSAIMPVLSRAMIVRQLRIQNDELKKKIAIRTAELEDANKELEAFSYSVSHDLRAPLRAIAGFSQILLRDYAQSLPDEMRVLLDKVTANTKHMNQLIEDLLRLSRIGHTQLIKRDVETTLLVQEVMTELLKDRPDGEIEIRIGSLPDCFADPALLEQLFVNLLSNALKFTRHREKPVIEVGSGRLDQEEFYFVRDNGAGFDMKYADRLFQVFQRLHRNTEFEGVGIGLSIVYRIVKRHNGRIWAEAKVDQGATFYFTLSG